LTTVCGTGGDIRFCGQKQTLILVLFCMVVNPLSYDHDHNSPSVIVILELCQ